MIEECYKRWYSALAALAVCGEKIYREALRFVDACRNVAMGNLYWSYVRIYMYLPMPTITTRLDRAYSVEQRQFQDRPLPWARGGLGAGDADVASARCDSGIRGLR